MIFYLESDIRFIHEDGIPFVSCYVSFDTIFFEFLPTIFLLSALLCSLELVCLLQNLQIQFKRCFLFIPFILAEVDEPHPQQVIMFKTNSHVQVSWDKQ